MQFDNEQEREQVEDVFKMLVQDYCGCQQQGECITCKGRAIAETLSDEMRDLVTAARAFELLTMHCEASVSVCNGHTTVIIHDRKPRAWIDLHIAPGATDEIKEIIKRCGLDPNLLKIEVVGELVELEVPY